MKGNFSFSLTTDINLIVNSDSFFVDADFLTYIVCKRKMIEPLCTLGYSSVLSLEVELLKRKFGKRDFDE